MKRIVAALLSIALCLSPVLAVMAEQAADYTIGSTVTLGTYEQDNVTDNGKEPVTWLVLDVQDGQALLLSQYCLDARAYNTDYVPMTWGECTLRTWMNDTFLNEAFTAQEQANIMPTKLTNADNPHYGTKGGEDTTDQIFFLSLTEVSTYLPTPEARRAQATAYATAQGAYLNTDNQNTWWWLRTPGVRPIDVCGISAFGHITGYGSRDVNRPSGAIRPALWVSITD